MMEAEIRRTPGAHLKRSEPKQRRTDGHEQIKITKLTQRTNSLFTCLTAGGSEAKP